VTRKGIHHPIQAAIEDVYVAGHTPRLQIDARREDVDLPDSVRRSWQARLVIDLDPSYPLELLYDADGVSVDLAFQGVVSRCRFGWRAIYAVIDRSTGRGIVVEAHLPPPELGSDVVWVDKAKKPRLSAVPSADPASSPSARPSALSSGSALSARPGARASTDGSRPIVPLAEHLASIPPTASEVDAVVKPPAGGTPSTAPIGSRTEPQPSPSVAPTSGSASDEAAKERRARFRIIDGGR
jgi:stringent starvation protein B